MAIGFDSSTESSTWTTTPDPFTFDATPAGTATWAALVIGQAVDDTNDVDGVPTLGGVPMNGWYSSVAGAMGTPPSRVYTWFLAGSWSSIQTVSIPHTATSNTKIATLIYGTGAGPVLSNMQGLSAEATGASTRGQRLVTTSAAMRFIVAYAGFGATSNLTPLSGMTAVSDHDYGSVVLRVDRESTTSTDFTIGYSETGQDTAQIAFAVEEGPAESIPFLYRYTFERTSTDHFCSYPHVESGDLLLASVFTEGSAITTPTDEAWVREDTNSGVADLEGGAFYLECDGSESGNVNFVTAIAQSVSVHLLHIPASYRDTGTPPEASIITTQSTGQPTFPANTPSWGTARTGWMISVGRDDDDGITAVGANYAGSFVYDDSSSDTSETIEQASGWRETTASSESPADPTTATTNEQWKSFTWAWLIDLDEVVDYLGSRLLSSRALDTYLDDTYDLT